MEKNWRKLKIHERAGYEVIASEGQFGFGKDVEEEEGKGETKPSLRERAQQQ